jgi:hypothetical protein
MCFCFVLLLVLSADLCSTDSIDVATKGKAAHAKKVSSTVDIMDPSFWGIH